MASADNMNAAARSIPSLELNNVAVAFVQSGRIQEAMELFQIALSILRDQLHGNPDSESQQGQDPQSNETTLADSSGVANVSSSATDAERRGALNLTGSDPVVIHLESTFLAAYDRALVINNESAQLDDLKLSAVILFNMALLHHSRGLRSTNGDSLDRASRLYCFALGILEMHHTPTANDLLWLALYNNLAHIDSYLFRIDSMKASLEQIRTLLRPLFDEDCNPIEEDDYNLFSVNAMYGRETSFKVAPAA
jgi:tetratricopeptide (TPR) repeat protein